MKTLYRDLYSEKTTKLNIFDVKGILKRQRGLAKVESLEAQVLTELIRENIIYHLPRKDLSSGLSGLHYDTSTALAVRGRDLKASIMYCMERNYWLVLLELNPTAFVLHTEINTSQVL